jgi:hypothetical protein
MGAVCKTVAKASVVRIHYPPHPYERPLTCVNAVRGRSRDVPLSLADAGVPRMSAENTRRNPVP